MAYNGLIRLKNQTDEAWSDIDVQLKRRYDLIPNLVETVKGYAAHEKGVFESVTQARALKSVFALAEAYPDLKTNQNFAKLQDELSDTENKIQASRRFYNGNVRDLNIRVESFPTNMIAQKLGFTKREFFEVENETEKAPVKVQF